MHSTHKETSMLGEKASLWLKRHKMNLDSLLSQKNERGAQTQREKVSTETMANLSHWPNLRQCR